MTAEHRVFIIDYDRGIREDIVSETQLLLMELSGKIWFYEREWSWLQTNSSTYFIPIFWSNDNRRFVDEFDNEISPFTRQGILTHFKYKG